MRTSSVKTGELRGGDRRAARARRGRRRRPQRRARRGVALRRRAVALWHVIAGRGEGPRRESRAARRARRHARRGRDRRRDDAPGNRTRRRPRAPPSSPPPSSESPARPHTPSGPKRTPSSKRASLRGTLELVGNVASHLGPALRLGRGVGNLGASHLFAAHGGNVRVGIARDPAFCHYFRDNLLALERAGAELVPFSPVAGDPLPSNCKGLLFGGGYPELYARELANNRGLRAAVTAFAAGGGAVYAECGGLAFLSQSMDDGSREVAFGKAAMCGLAPFSTRGALERDAPVGAVRVVAREGCPLFPAGSDLRGYARRRSAVVAEPALAAGPGTVWGTQNGGEGDTPSRGGRWFAAYDVFRAGEEEKERRTRPETTSSKAEMDENVSKEGVVRAAVRAIESAEAPRRANDVPGIGRVEGYAWRNVVASYARLHFGDAPEVAAHFVDACRAVPHAAAEAADARRRRPRRPAARAHRPLERAVAPAAGVVRETDVRARRLPARRRRVLGLAQRARRRPRRPLGPGFARACARARRRLFARALRGVLVRGPGFAGGGRARPRRRRRRGVWLGHRWGASLDGERLPERDVDRRRCRRAFGRAASRSLARARLATDVSTRSTRGRLRRERSGLVTRNAGSRLRSTAARKARTSTPSASNVATSVPDARRRSRRRRPTSPAPASISSVAARADRRVRATDAISKSQSSGVLFHRSHSAASFGSGSASANAHHRAP